MYFVSRAVLSNGKKYDNPAVSETVGHDKNIYFTHLLTNLKLCNNLERKEFLSNLYASSTVLPIGKLW